jgi:VIT1/CCC1 family predicted Fe2+/Mn2+ transporter
VISSVVPASHAPAVAERHRGARSGWLRAVVLGADDGIVSVASLAIGVVASGASHTAVVTAAGAALVAGAMSMAAGEYVSVSSQSDIASADLARERVELAADPAGELSELAAIYVRRGVPADLARPVATALMARDPLAAHARDELGLTEEGRARPVQAALSSAASFALGAALPMVALIVAPSTVRVVVLIMVSLLTLVLLGVAAARAGGAQVGRAALRVGLGGTAAIAVTALVGRLFGAVTG